MDAMQRHSDSALSELHERTGTLPPTARPEASEQ